ncbi:MAG TPA: hypothetical protein PLI62_00345 [Spirochaetota bacterium]|nr:hypothetical protein [Spirochaetota bacterium]
MINLKEIINTIGAAIEDQLPAILSPLGLADFKEYVYGPPRDDKKSTCAVMYDPLLSIDVVEARIPILFYLQLYEIDYETALLYCSAIQNFISGYDAHKIGMLYVDALNIDIIPIERERSTLCYVSVTFVNPKDSCDD